MMHDYKTGEYGNSIQKIMPKSRDYNPMGVEDQGVYSSKPTGGHQNGPYQSLNVEENNNDAYNMAPTSNPNRQEIMRQQE